LFLKKKFKNSESFNIPENNIISVETAKGTTAIKSHAKFQLVESLEVIATIPSSSPSLFLGQMTDHKWQRNKKN
jgi:hypothetical protein